MGTCIIPDGTYVKLMRTISLITTNTYNDYSQTTFPKTSIREVKDYTILNNRMHSCTLVDPISHISIHSLTFNPSDKIFQIASNEDIGNYMYVNQPKTDTIIEHHLSETPLRENGLDELEAI